MKKFFLLVMLSIIIMPTTYAATYANESSSFYGIALGGTVADLQRSGYTLTPVGENVKTQVTIYKSDNSNRNFFNTSFDLVTYNFYHGKLLFVQAVKFADTTLLYSDSVVQQITAKHGSQSNIDENAINKTKTYTWMGSTTYLELVYDYYKKEIRLNAYNYPLYRDWQLYLRNNSQGRTKF